MMTYERGQAYYLSGIPVPQEERTIHLLAVFSCVVPLPGKKLTCTLACGRLRR